MAVTMKNAVFWDVTPCRSCGLNVFRQNGYNGRLIHRVLNRCPDISQTNDNPDSVAFLPYVSTIFNHISRVLSQHNIKSVGLPPRKVCRFLRPVKDNLGLRTLGVYTG
jgi:hypothetical protein